MTSDIKSPVLSTLKATGSFVDNTLAESMRRLKVSSLLSGLGVKKVFGASADEIFFVIVLAPIIKAQSLWAFCDDFLNQLRVGKKDVIYRFLLREDIPWAALLRRLASAFVRCHEAELHNRDRCALIIDDSLTHRSGRIEGSSDMWDHVEKRTVRCQRTLSVGLAFAKGFIPLASRLCPGKKKLQGRKKPFQDGRSEVARAFSQGLEKSKFELLKTMIRAISRTGIKAGWLIGDSGFGTRSVINLALDQGMEALFLMKRGRLRYRIGERFYTAKMLFALLHRRMRPAAGGRFRSFAFLAEINLEEDRQAPPRWVKVQLMLSRPAHNHNPDGWVMSLCTHREVSVDRMIELYSMRWSIEVFFKESKQALGHLNNQSGNYVSSYASIHLSAIRYLLLLHGALTATQSGEIGLTKLRVQQHQKLTLLSYMGLWWNLFTKLIFGVLDTMREQFGTAVIDNLKIELETQLTDFIDLAFQIDINGPQTDSTHATP